MAEDLETQMTEAQVGAILERTVDHGFLSGLTIATMLELQERIIIALLDRLGGEVHLPDFPRTVARAAPQELAARIEEGTYVLFSREAVDVHGFDLPEEDEDAGA